MTIEKIYAVVEDKYFNSGDFNGLPVRELEATFDIGSPEFREIVRTAIESNVITVRVGGNPHILAFSSMPKDHVLDVFDKAASLGEVCMYPSADRLKASSRLSAYSDRPYDYELARGQGQLDFRTFDLSVLEYYRNDPRYSYSTDFIHGQICIENAHYSSTNVPDHDKVLLNTFGFAYDEDINRYVAVFLRYLSKLSPEHQRVWQAKEVSGNIKLHPDYYASTIEGSWGTRLSIFEAFVMELQAINEMSSTMGRTSLFRHSYADERPKEFGFLLRPTVAEFNDFILLLDKMMSDNINKDFFGSDVDLETEEEREDGKIVVKPKGTVQILETWFAKLFKAADSKPIGDMIATFKKVRKLRQKPAHKVNPDAFDQEILREQRSIVIEAYNAVRTLRQALANHPAVKRNPPDIDEQLFKGEIWDV